MAPGPRPLVVRLGPWRLAMHPGPWQFTSPPGEMPRPPGDAPRPLAMCCLRPAKRAGFAFSTAKKDFRKRQHKRISEKDRKKGSQNAPRPLAMCLGSWLARGVAPFQTPRPLATCRFVLLNTPPDGNVPRPLAMCLGPWLCAPASGDAHRPLPMRPGGSLVGSSVVGGWGQARRWRPDLCPCLWLQMLCC